MGLAAQAEAHEASSLEEVVAAEPEFARFVEAKLDRAKWEFLQ